METQSARSEADGGRRSSPASAWQRLKQPASSDEFYDAWLALLCGGLRGTVAGLLLMRGAEDAFQPAARWPDDALDAAYMRDAAQRALAERSSVLAPHADRSEANDRSSRVLLAHPIVAGSDLIGVVVLDLHSSREVEWKAALEQVSWAVGWPEALFWKQKAISVLSGEAGDGLASGVLRAADQHDRFPVAAVLAANRIAEGLECDRVSIGLSGPKGLAVEAISHSATFDRKSNVVAGLAAAMQEAFDQHNAIAVPATPRTARRIDVAHAQFVEQWKSACIASVLLLAGGSPIGVITLERSEGHAFDEETLAEANKIAEAIGPLLHLKYRQDRLFGGRLLDASAEFLANLIGPDRLALKLGALLATGLILVLSLWPTEFRVSAKAVLEGSIQRAAVAPFDGFIAKAPLRAGDFVRTGQEIAVLDDRDLQLDRLKWETERQKLVQRHREALAKHERTNLLVLGSQLEQVQSQLTLAEEKLKRARITAPIDGIIVSGDLSQMLGGPVTQGKVLFEIAPLSSYRIILQIDERDVSHVKLGQSGSLLLTGAVSEGIPITISKLTPVATAEDGRNYFRVEAAIGLTAQPLRPGMEGIAKVEVGSGSILWVWLRPLIERARMLAWAWSP